MLRAVQGDIALGPQLGRWVAHVCDVWHLLLNWNGCAMGLELMRVQLQEAEAKRPRLQGPPAKQGPPASGAAPSQAAALAAKQPEAERAGPSQPASSASELHAPCLF